MPYNDKDKANECQRRFYAKNPQVYKDHRKRRELEARQFMRESKEGKTCTDCGVAYPPHILEYDHLPGHEKECHPAEIPKKGWGIERMKKELAKCEIVCANCHRERTHSRRNMG